jgi:hypothetical protein
MNELKIQQVYTEFTDTMKLIYDNVKNHYVTLGEKILMEDDLGNMDFPRIPVELDIQGLSYFLEKEFKQKFTSPNVTLRKATQIA